MITVEIYKEQMKRLEGLMNYKISDQSYKAWKDSLEEDGFEDKHLIAGISKIKDWLRDPEKKLRGQDVNYGTLARACGNVRRDYVLYESDQERAKRVARENEEARKNTISNMLAVKGKSPAAQAYCNNLNDYMVGRIDRLTWLQRQKALQHKYMNRHQAILDREIKKCNDNLFPRELAVR